MKAAVALFFFLALNFSVLSVSLHLAIKFRLKGVLLWTACLEIYFFLITMVIAGLGFAGLLKPLWISLVVAVAGLSVWANRDFRSAFAELFGWRESFSFLCSVFAALLGLVFLVLLYDAISHPFFMHDPMTYELYFPARWLQDGRLGLIPTPFGDNSRAYDAGNAILYYFWLLFPLQSDLLAHCGEIFFVGFSVLCLMALSEELGVSRPAAYLPGLFFLSIPLVMREAEAAHTDFLLCGQLLAFLVFALAHRHQKGRGLALLAIAALGGMLGSKYIALAFSPILLPGFFMLLRPWPGLKRLFFWGIVLVLAGGFWYVRNYALTGNPVYPLELRLGSRVVFAGAYTREVMNNWLYGFSNWKEMVRLMIDGPRPEFQLVLLFFLAACSLFALGIGLSAPGRRNRAWLYLAFCPFLCHLFAAYVLPFHMDRFWLPFWAFSCLSLAIIFARHKFYGSLFAVFMFMLSGLEMVIYVWSEKIRVWSIAYPSSASPGLLLKLLLPACFLALVFRRRNLRFKALLWSLAFITLCLTGFSAGYQARRGMAIEFSAESRFLESFPSGTRVAYTGRNTPYPLMGPRLDKPVFYVNVNSHRDWAFHDYGKWFRDKFPERMPHTPEPAFYRMENNFHDWVENLAVEKVELLVVCPVGVNEWVNICHDRSGFPIEDRWASSHPGIFKLVFEDKCRIYQLMASAVMEFSPVDSESEFCPLDALELLESAPDELPRYFPYALAQIKRDRLIPISK